MNQTLSIFAITALLALAGCADESSVVCYPVSGNVLRDGKAVAEAMIVLHPVSASVELRQKPIAFTDADGRFVVTTFDRGDGAPAGQYQVTVDQRAMKQVGEEMVREGRRLLPARLSDPQTSGIAIEIAEGVNEIPTISLPTK
jgi:hypothetical protein